MRRAASRSAVVHTCRRLLIAITLLAVLLGSSGCATRPETAAVGEPLEHGWRISVVDLYTYFQMCLAAWRVRDQFRDTGWDLHYFEHEETNTLGFTLEKRQTLHVVFRATHDADGAPDLRINFTAYPRSPAYHSEDSNVRAHAGFLTRYEAVREEIARRVEASELDRILLIGHSAGGAVAKIAFEDLRTQYPEHDIRVIAYGTPRVLNRAGARDLAGDRERILRVVNGDDLIPRSPPAFLGYRHVGILLRIGTRRPYPFASWHDHHPGYREVLEEMLRDYGIAPAELGLD